MCGIAHNAYGCDVTLPDHGSSSYLLFQKFSLSISGLKITESLENLVKLSNDHTELEDEEYTFGKDRIASIDTALQRQHTLTSFVLLDAL